MCRAFFKQRFLAVWLLVASTFSVCAATITNVTVVNVTPTSFGLLWHGSGGTPSIALFADAKGTTNITSQFGIEFFPVITGSPDAATPYARRQSQLNLKQKIQSYSTVLVRITALRPNTTYYYQLSWPSAGSTISYPASGDLPGVTTEQENTFVIDDQQLILDVPGVDTLGQVVTLSHTNAAHPLAAVVGDGVETNQVFFNLNDLFAAAGTGNIAPLGAQTFDLTVWDGKGPDTVAQFTISFGLTFTTAHGNPGSFAIEFLALNIGSAVLQVGQSTNVPVGFDSSVGISSVDVVMDVPAGHLSNLALSSVASEIDTANMFVTVQNVSNVVLHLPARSGQLLMGNKKLAEFAFQATAGKSSAFVPLKISQVSGSKLAGTLVTNLTVTSGRLVLVGAEPLLEGGPVTKGRQVMTLYATPQQSYALEYTTRLGTNAVWKRLPPLAISNLVTQVMGTGETLPQVFYRALQYNADPPYIEARQNANGSRYVIVFGKPGSSYVIESAPALTAQPSWTPITNISLSTVPYTTVPISTTNTQFLRTGEKTAH